MLWELHIQVTVLKDDGLDWVADDYVLDALLLHVLLDLLVVVASVLVVLMLCDMLLVDHLVVDLSMMVRSVLMDFSIIGLLAWMVVDDFIFIVGAYDAKVHFLLLHV